MERLGTSPNRRVLVVDDEPLVHHSFRSILAREYQVEFASGGEAGVEMVRRALDQARPYAAAFIDISMVPGIDGVEALSRMWQLTPDLEAVLCTGRNDFTWSDVARRVGQTDRLLILKKPFDTAEVLQLACALTKKWWLSRHVQLNTAQLELMVEERTREIDEARVALLSANLELAAARDAAEAASRAKSAFLANISHEIRTPMTAILGFADVLWDHVSSPDGVAALDTIRRNGTYLLEILGDVLDLSKIEAGKLELESIDCSPAAIVDEVVALMQVRAEAKRLRLTVTIEDPVPETIRTDPTRLRQILLNLVGNALKFTHSGEVRILVRTIRPDRGEPRLRFDVIDTGIGMTDDQLDRLFQPFVQADSSTTRRFGGAGLGLAISRRIARMLGGDIEVSRNRESGCTFALTLAACFAAPHGKARDATAVTETSAAGPAGSRPLPPAPRSPSAHEPQAGAQLSDLTGRSVLLAEDGPDNQRLIAYLLEKAGAETAVVENGREAIEAALAAECRGRPYDLILMDMQMPVTDGYQAARELRERGYDGPIIALTAHAMTDDRQKCLEAGCDGYAAKPIDRRRLAELVATHCRPARSDPIKTGRHSDGMRKS